MQKYRQTEIVLIKEGCSVLYILFNFFTWSIWDDLYISILTLKCEANFGSSNHKVRFGSNDRFVASSIFLFFFVCLFESKSPGHVAILQQFNIQTLAQFALRKTHTRCLVHFTELEKAIQV